MSHLFSNIGRKWNQRTKKKKKKKKGEEKKQKQIEAILLSLLHMLVFIFGMLQFISDIDVDIICFMFEVHLFVSFCISSFRSLHHKLTINEDVVSIIELH